MTPEHAWEHLSDFSTLGDWLKMHQGWRCELPAELEVGTTLVGVAGVKGMRNRVTWTVRGARLNPPVQQPHHHPQPTGEEGQYGVPGVLHVFTVG